MSSIFLYCRSGTSYNKEACFTLVSKYKNVNVEINDNQLLIPKAIIRVPIKFSSVGVRRRHSAGCSTNGASKNDSAETIFTFERRKKIPARQVLLLLFTEWANFYLQHLYSNMQHLVHNRAQQHAYHHKHNFETAWGSCRTGQLKIGDCLSANKCA
jgi:hypothetical protein